MAEHSDNDKPGEERTLVDATGEFFSVGARLHAVRAGYVRRGADHVLYETVAAGRYAHIIAPDRTGKSSLVAAVSARLENNGFKVAILDLEQIGVRDAGADAGRWYYSVAYRLLRQLRIRVDLQSWWQDKSILGNQQRLLEFYSEIILQNIQERIVVFVDEIQCIGELPFGDELLSSIRAAHNARATDPEFARLTFVLLGECDPLSLVDEPELSPFNITQPVSLGDFSRADIDIFGTELNLATQDAALALDRIYYWTAGQPYLTQKLARAVARDRFIGDVAENVDRIAMHQLAGRQALRNEPHMSHIHREVVNNRKQREGLLNLYGRIRKGVSVDTDLASPLQRRLIAIGLIRIDEEGRLRVRNRLYENVFTARWANENLKTSWRTPAIAAVVVLVSLAIPFWYTQLLPRSYSDLLTSMDVELEIAREAYENLRSFPGHDEAADNLMRNFLIARASLATEESQIESIAAMTEALADVGRLPDEIRAGFWDRQVSRAVRQERRDEALIAAIQSLVLSTQRRRNRAAALVGEDYPRLIASFNGTGAGNVTLDSGNLILTSTQAAEVYQWSLENNGLQARDPWIITALEVTPLVRRVIVDRSGQVSRAGLTLNLSHVRASDLRIKLIAPSGRAVEVHPGVERASSNQDLRIPPEQLRDLIGEALNGTWSLSVRDERLGVAGHLVGWNLSLNSQGVVEEFQRGLNVADPVERETENLWFSGDGQYAVARAMQSDSARVWDLAFAQPVRAIAVTEHEQVIGLSLGARLLVTATQETVNLWDTASGIRVATLPIGAASLTSTLTDDGQHLLVQRRSDVETVFEIWALDSASLLAELSVAGTPALVAVDAGGSRIAVADYDRAVRIWDLRTDELVAQIDLATQPSEIKLAAGGEVLGVVSGSTGVSMWRVDRPNRALFQQSSRGQWQLVFSASGARALIGRSGAGFRVYNTRNGAFLGPVIGAGDSPDARALLAFSSDEQTIVTAGGGSVARFWNAAAATPDDVDIPSTDHEIWPPSGGAIAAVTPDAKTVAVGDVDGDVHILRVGATRDELQAESENVSFIGHDSPVRQIAVSADGSRFASAANDNTLRIWSAADRLPKPYFTSVPADAISNLAFSPDASSLIVLNGPTLSILDVATGNIVAKLDLGEQNRSVAVADADHVYVGSESGVLKVVSRESSGRWTVQQLWQGSTAIRWLESSPRGQTLILVDQNNLARQFDLVQGRIGEAMLQLPSEVQDVTFAPLGTRVLFRTTGWIHRASSSLVGLRWIDAILAPRGLDNARIVFGAMDGNPSASSGSDFYVPVAGEMFVELAHVGFGTDTGSGLFGNKDHLLDEWRRKLGLSEND